jgi:MFS family permease
MAGLLLLGVYIAGNSLSLLSEGSRSGKAGRKIKALAITLGLCVIAAAVNPEGLGILLFPFELSQKKFLMDNITEWQSPNFHYLMPYGYMLLLLMVVVGISALRLTAIEAMLVLLFTYMSLYSARHVPLFALIASPVIGSRMEDIIQRWKGNRYVNKFVETTESISKTDSAARGHVWPAVAVVSVIVLAMTGRISYEFSTESFPVRAVEFMKQEKISGNMFNHDEFGDYIIYAAWPEYKVFFDGRSDMYGSERLKEYFDVIFLRPEMGEVLDKYDIKWVIYKAKSPLSAYLTERDDWNLVYADEVANIYVKDTAENAGLIERHRRTGPSL